MPSEDTELLKAIALLLASSSDLTGATPITLTAAEKLAITALIGHTLT